MNRGRIRDFIRKRLGETTAAFWTDQELNEWIDDSGYAVADDTKCIRTEGYITTVEDQMEYTTSTYFPTYLSILEVYMYQDATTWVRLEQTDRKRLSREYAGWKSADASVPWKYYWDKEEDVLGLYPKPNSTNAGTNYLQVYYANDYTPITDDGVTPAGISDALQLAMIDWVVASGYETRGWGDKANDAWSKYNQRTQRYMVKRDTEKQEDEEAVVMKNYRNK